MCRHNLELFDKGLVTDQLVLDVGFDSESLANPDIRQKYSGVISINRYGKAVPKPAHGSSNLGSYTSSSKSIISAVEILFDKIVNPNLLIRRLNLSANHVISKNNIPRTSGKQLSLLETMTDFNQKNNNYKSESRKQKAILAIRHKYGNNSILKGTNFQEGPTARIRNKQIGGHRA